MICNHPFRFLILILGLFTLWGNGQHALSQNVDYKILYDDPVAPKLSINLDLISMDMGVKNLDGSSINIGTFGYFEPVAALGAQWNIKKSILSLGKLGYKEFPGNLDASLGGYFMLQRKTVTKSTRIILSREYKGTTYSKNVSGDRMKTTTEEVTFITIPAKRYVQRGLRGGFYFKRGAFTSENVEIPGIDEMSLTSMGVYGGITARSIKNVFIETSTNGVQYNSIGDDFALDVLFIPVNSFRDLNDDNNPVGDQVRTTLGNFPLGFRLVWLRYQVEGKAKTGKKFGYAGSFEGGYKPYQGWYIGFSYGITLVK